MNSSSRNSALRRRLASGGSLRAASIPRSRGADRSGALDGNTAGDTAPEPSTFWKVANAECKAFDLPRGLEVMPVEVDAVLEALTYYVDAFGTPWVAVATQEDDEVLWVPRYDPALPLTEEPKQPWLTQVSDGDGKAPAGTCDPVAAALSQGTTLQHSFSSLPDEANMFGEFWKRRDWVPIITNTNNGGDRDWNSEYQALVDALVHSPTASGVTGAATAAAPAAGGSPTTPDGTSSATEALRGRIRQLYVEFADTCQDVISTIIGEMFAPQAERTVKATSMGLYFHGGICFRICYDTSGGVFGGDENAMKVAAQTVRAYSHASAVAPRFLLHMPLTFMMTHLGFRILASTIPPVAAASRLPLESLSPAARGPGAMVTDCARELGLKTHPVQLSVAGSTTGAAAQSPLPVESGVFWGRDGRLYLLNTARLLPPIAPVATMRSHGYDPSASGLFWRLRPEILSGSGKTLSPDAFVPGCSTRDDNADVVKITEWMRDTNIPTVAAVLGMLEPTLAETDTFTCVATGEEYAQHLSFVVCANEEECCRIGPQAYVDLMKTVQWDDEMEKGQERLDGWVKCGAPSRQPFGLIMKPDVTTIFHAHGLNMRYLPYVWARIPNLSKPCASHYVEVEMIARAAKEILWRGLRQATDLESRRTVCVNFYLGLLQREGELAEAFWADSLGPAIAATFGVHHPFDMSRIDPFLVHSRIGDLTGVELTMESLASFYTDEPFVQLETPHPRMKNARLPDFVERAGERREYMAAQQEALDALDKDMRAKFAPQSAAEASEDAVVAAAWADLRPAYLRDPSW